MDHITPYELFENSDERDLLGDLLSIGMNEIKLNFVSHSDSWLKLEDEVVGEIEEWKGPKGEKVTEVNGDIVADGEFNKYNVEVKLTNGKYLIAEEDIHLVDYQRGETFTVFLKMPDGSEKSIGNIPLDYIEKDEEVPGIMKDHVYESSIGLGVILRMLNLYSKTSAS